MDAWRDFLYPLGFLPMVFFGLRFVVQWIQSERVGHSVVPSLFWQLSLTGNLLMILHYSIQLQYPFAFLQVINGVISWRNLNLMGATSKPRLSGTKTLEILTIAITTLTLSFVLQGVMLNTGFEWLRIPTSLWGSASAPKASLQWHTLGILGSCLFASRFWVQWWEAERNQKSELGPTFWWLSLVGNLLSLAYFTRTVDVVSLANTGFGFIPALRNLFLLRKRAGAEQS